MPLVTLPMALMLALPTPPIAPVAAVMLPASDAKPSSSTLNALHTPKLLLVRAAHVPLELAHRRSPLTCQSVTVPHDAPQPHSATRAAATERTMPRGVWRGAQEVGRCTAPPLGWE